MMMQMRLPEIQEFEEVLISEKIVRVNAEQLEGIRKNPDEKNWIEYVSNKPTRIIEYVMNLDMKWIKRERVVKECSWKPTEVVRFEDKRQLNRELLPVDAFVDQGTSQPKDPRFPSDKPIQRECVIGKGGRMLAFHLKIKEPEPFWTKTEWLMNRLDCTEQDATRFGIVFTKLKFDKTTVLGLIEDIINGEFWIEYLEALAEELPDLEGDMIRDEPQDTGEFFSEFSIAKSFPREYLLLKRFMKKEKEDPPEPKTSPFGLHPLHYEEDGCSHDFLTYLRFATIQEIKGAMKGFFPGKGKYGQKTRPKFWYLTQSQRSQAWQYINDRRRELGIYEEKLKLG